MRLFLGFALLCALSLLACTRNFPGKGQYVLKVVSQGLPIAQAPRVQVVDAQGNTLVISNVAGRFNRDSSEFVSEPIEVGARIWASVTAQRAEAAEQEAAEQEAEQEAESEQGSQATQAAPQASPALRRDLVLELQLLRNNKVVRKATKTWNVLVKGALAAGTLEHQISMPYLAGGNGIAAGGE